MGAQVGGFREAGSASRIENSERGVDIRCSRAALAPILGARDLGERCANLELP